MRRRHRVGLLVGIRQQQWRRLQLLSPPPVLLLRNIIPDTQVNVEGLLEGLTYIFRVAAENQAGPGKFSVPSDPKTAQSPICTYPDPGPARPLSVKTH